MVQRGSKTHEGGMAEDLNARILGEASAAGGVVGEAAREDADADADAELGDCEGRLEHLEVTPADVGRREADDPDGEGEGDEKRASGPERRISPWRIKKAEEPDRAAEDCSAQS